MRPLLRRVTRPLFPIINTIRTYRAEDFPHDLMAGLTVSVVDLPQSMAFAIIAGVPPVYGLYTAIFLAFLGALFTSSRFLSVGPTNTQSLLVAAVVSRLTNDPQVYVQLVIGLSLVKGLIQLAFAAAQMGQLVRYVSHSVMIGFTAGAGVLIFLEQVPNFLGLPHAPRLAGLPGVLGAAHRLLPHLGEVSLRTAFVGAGSLAVLVICRRISERLPGPLLAVAGAALVVWLAGWSDVPVVGELPRGLPGFSWPRLSWLQAEQLLPGALAVAVLGMLESVAIAKAIAQRTGQRISADQEFFGQGFANVVGSFFQCMPGSGSFSRTALQYAAGARTRITSIVCAVSNAIIFLSLAALAQQIPLVSLAAILFFVAYTLIDAGSIWRIVRTSRPDAIVCLVTLAAALIVPLTYAIYVGIFLSIAVYVRQATHLHLVQMRATADHGFREDLTRPLGEQGDAVVFLQLEGDLFFGVADELEGRLAELARSRARVVIFRLKLTHSIDATVLFKLEQFIEVMHARGAHVLFCGVRAGALDTLRSFGISRLVGEEHVFEATPGVFGSARRALERAKEIVAREAAEKAPAADDV